MFLTISARFKPGARITVASDAAAEGVRKVAVPNAEDGDHQGQRNIIKSIYLYYLAYMGIIYIGMDLK